MIMRLQISNIDDIYEPINEYNDIKIMKNKVRNKYEKDCLLRAINMWENEGLIGYIYYDVLNYIDNIERMLINLENILNQETIEEY